MYKVIFYLTILPILCMATTVDIHFKSGTTRSAVFIDSTGNKITIENAGVRIRLDKTLLSMIIFGSGDTVSYLGYTPPTEPVMNKKEMLRAESTDNTRPPVERKAGLYKTYTDFYYNRPEQCSSSLSLKTTEPKCFSIGFSGWNGRYYDLMITDSTGVHKWKDYKHGDIWGYSDGQRCYVKIRGNLCPLHFSGDVIWAYAIVNSAEGFPNELIGRFDLNDESMFTMAPKMRLIDDKGGEEMFKPNMDLYNEFMNQSGMKRIKTFRDYFFRYIDWAEKNMKPVSQSE